MFVLKLLRIEWLKQCFIAFLLKLKSKLYIDKFSHSVTGFMYTYDYFALVTPTTNQYKINP